MKKTKYSRLFFILQLVFMLVIPCVLIWMQYGGVETISVKYKLSMTGVILIIIVFMLAKRFVFDKWAEKQKAKLAQIETLQLGVTEPASIVSYKKKYRQISTMLLILDLIVPCALFAVSLLTINVVQAGLIKLFGVLVFSGISIGLGVLCKAGEIYSLKCEHEG